MEHINKIAGPDRQFHPICLDSIVLVSLLCEKLLEFFISGF